MPLTPFILAALLFAQPSATQPPAQTKPAEKPPTPSTTPDTKPQSKLGPDNYRASNSLPDPLQDGTQGSALEVKDRAVIHGEALLKPDTVRQARNADRLLRISTFQVTPGTVMVQVDVSTDSKLTLLTKSAASETDASPIRLRSSDGQNFEPVGYWYQDDTKVKIRYTPDKPLRTRKDLLDAGVLPTKSRSDQHLYLLFTPSFGVDITRLTLGKTTIHDFTPPLKLDQKQK